MNFLDLIFPKKCVSCGEFGNYLCRSCFSKINFIELPICPVCSRQAIGGQTHPGCQSTFGLSGLVVACRYRGPVRRLIKAIKYKFAFDVTGVLCEMIALNLWRFSVPPDFIIVPIPLYMNRENWRGFNQAKVLCSMLSEKYKVKTVDLLVRTRETASQVGLNKQERKLNMKNVFSLKAGFRVNGQNIMIVDDVFTTGSTVREAAKVLKRAGAKSVWAMAVALD